MMITLPAMALLAALGTPPHAGRPASVSSTPIWTSAVALSRRVRLEQRPAPVPRMSAHRGTGISPVVLGALIGAAAGGTIGFLMTNCNGCDERGLGMVPGVLIGAPAGALFAAFAR